MDISLKKKLDLFLKFGRTVEADNLVHEKLSDSQDIELIIYYIHNSLMPRRKLNDALKLLETVKSSEVNSEKVKALVQLVRDKQELQVKKMADLTSSDFMEFKKFALNFEIPKIPSQASIKGIRKIKSYSTAIRLCHDQNIEEPYTSWNAYRSKAAKSVFNYAFDNNIEFSIFERSTMKQIHGHLEEVISGENLLFFDDVVADFQEIGRGILIERITQAHQLMLLAYKSGVFPCGVIQDSEVVALQWVAC